MENLSRIAQGIFLGNGEVWNFLDYAVNRNCGGLMTYTQRMDFLGSNLINNFNGGFKRRYGYNDIHTSETYAIDRAWGGLRGAPRGFGGSIGDLYRVDESTNSENNFITKEEYTELQNKIREKQLNANTPSLYSEKVSESYSGQFEDKWKGTKLELRAQGSETNIVGYIPIERRYTLDEFSKKAKEVNEGYQKIVKNKIRDNRLFPGIYRDYSTYTVESYNGSEMVSLSEGNYRNRKINEEGRIYAFLKPLKSVATDKHNTLKKYQSASQRFIELASKNVVLRDNVTFNGLLFEYTTEGTEILGGPKIGNYGLYGYYNNERLTNKERLIFWKPNKSYGVEFNERGEEYYSINEENKFKGNVSISSKFNGEGHSVYDVNSGVRSYILYEEGGVDRLAAAGHTSDGMSVASSSYENGSRLLKKTNELFKQSKINSLINRFHIKADKDELTTAYDNTYGLSRGRNLLKADKNPDKSSGYDNPYCRVWTARHQYSKLKDRIRPFVDDAGNPQSIEQMQSNYGNLRPNDGAYRLSEYSVLRNDGFVRITPTNTDGDLFGRPQNYMFSIENLAWRDVTVDSGSTALSKEQKGPNGGRIMWFPPYNLKFSENVNVNWNANTFIGRGEEIYTYTNTVRNGTLDFTLLIDHPSILNKWRGQLGNINEDEKQNFNEDILRFFAGCGNLNDVVSSSQTEEKEKYNVENRSIDPKPKTYTKDIAYVMFFPNDFSANDYMDGVITISEGENTKTKSKIKYACENILEVYNTTSGSVETKRDDKFKDEVLQSHNLKSEGFDAEAEKTAIRKTLFGGDDKIEIKFIDDLIDIKSNFKGDTIFGYKAENCKVQKITVCGFASSHGKRENNIILANRRRKFIEKAMYTYSVELSPTVVNYVPENGRIIEVQNIDGREDVNGLDAKIARAAYAIVSIEWKEENVTHEGSLVTANSVATVYGLNVDNIIETENIEENAHSNIKSQTTVIEGDYTYDNEYLYFSEISRDSLVHKHIVDKVKYFDPAFHSITPEGFNARLTFLHQCTRQGPTNAISSGHINSGSEDFLKFAGNLSFGRAPYCILRIGDFFNTKICIDSMSITYDNNGVQWDLNPEGVGVQPMYANISLSFKFLGGQDIVKPIERLQNAVTANYYANASIYSRHADNNKNYYDALEDSIKYRIINEKQ